MAIGKKNRSDLKAFSFKVKLKDGDKFLDKPAFEVSRREGDKYVALPEREYEVSGNLIGIEPREYVYNKSVIRSFVATLQDKDEIYFINVGLNSLGRSLANAFLSLKAFDDISIGLYATKPKVDGGRSFPAASLRQAGEIIRWRYQLSELPSPKETTFKGQVQRDFEDQEVFLAKQLAELNKLVKSRVPVQATATAEVAAQAEDGEDVPF